MPINKVLVLTNIIYFSLMIIVVVSNYLIVGSGLSAFTCFLKKANTKVLASVDNKKIKIEKSYKFYECNKIGGCSVGNVTVTGGGDLKAKYVIHAVGPQWDEGEEDNKLKNATINSLKRAKELQLTAIAFPALSTGVLGFPMDRAASIRLRTICGYLKGATCIKYVVLVLFNKKGFNIFKKLLMSTDTWSIDSL